MPARGSVADPQGHACQAARYRRHQVWAPASLQAGKLRTLCEAARSSLASVVEQTAGGAYRQWIFSNPGISSVERKRREYAALLRLGSSYAIYKRDEPASGHPRTASRGNPQLAGEILRPPFDRRSWAAAVATGRDTTCIIVGTMNARSIERGPSTGQCLQAEEVRWRPPVDAIALAVCVLRNGIHRSGDGRRVGSVVPENAEGTDSTATS